MSTMWSRRMTAFVVCLVLALPAFLPGNLFGQAVETGKWALTTAFPTRTFYLNGSGASQKVMFTICVSSGGAVQYTGAGSSIVALGECETFSEFLPSGQSLNLLLQSGTSSSGTYSMSVLP